MNAKSPSTSKHTPGPWSANPGSSSDSHYMVFKADGSYLTLDGEEHESNARLIAAAPELLEALKAFVDHLPSIIRQLPYGVPMAVSEAHDKARAIIAKAEGGDNV